MSTQEFFNKWTNKYIDFDGFYGAQCMDLYRQYCKETLEIPQSPPVNGAADVWLTYRKDKFTAIKNTPTGVPQFGDIVIWNKKLNSYGHIAICQSADIWNFTSFDQNFPIGSTCHLQKHNYKNVIGWLRPIPQILPGTVTIARVGVNLPPGHELQAQVAHFTGGKLSIVINDYNVPLADSGMLTQEEAYQFLREHQILEKFVQLYYQTPNGPFAVSYSFPEQKKYISTLPNNPPVKGISFELSHCLQYFCNENLNAHIQVEDSNFPDENFIQRKYNTVLKYLDKLN